MVMANAANAGVKMSTCLIVDDSRVIRKVSRHILETLGFAVNEAEHGKEGLERCESVLQGPLCFRAILPCVFWFHSRRLLGKA